MSQPRTQRDLLNTQLSAEDQLNSTSSELNHNELYKIFRIVGNDQIGYVITVGKYRVSNPTKTIEESKQIIDNDDWEFRTSVFSAIYETYIEQRAIALNELKKAEIIPQDYE